MDYVDMNTELKNFCNQLVNDGYNKTQICKLILGQQNVPRFTQFLEDDDKNFGIKVLAQIFDTFGYRLDIVPVLKTVTDEDPKTTECYNKFFENYHMMMSEGLSNQENSENKVGRSNTVSLAINDVALQMFQQITQKGL